MWRTHPDLPIVAVIAALVWVAVFALAAWLIGTSFATVHVTDVIAGKGVSTVEYIIDRRMAVTAGGLIATAVTLLLGVLLRYRSHDILKHAR